MSDYQALLGREEMGAISGRLAVIDIISDSASSEVIPGYSTKGLSGLSPELVEERQRLLDRHLEVWDLVASAGTRFVRQGRS